MNQGINAAYERGSMHGMGSGSASSDMVVEAGDPITVLGCCEAHSNAIDHLMKVIDQLEARVGPALHPSMHLETSEVSRGDKLPSEMKQSEVIERMQDTLRRLRRVIEHLDRISGRIQIVP